MRNQGPSFSLWFQSTKATQPHTPSQTPRTWTPTWEILVAIQEAERKPVMASPYTVA